MSIPAYLRKTEEAEYYYGELKYEAHSDSWVIDGEPCVIDMAKRLFPGSSGKGAGQARFKSTKRINGDLNWLMQRYPLKVKEPERWGDAYNQAVEHVIKLQDLNRLPQKVTPPLEFKGELRGFQEEGHAFMLHNHRTLLADEMGLGKAQPLDAKILTPYGWKRMGDIQVDDEVVNSKGKTSKVIGIYPQGEKAIYKVEFTDGSATECCEEHLWQVNSPVRSWRGYAPKVLPLKEIMGNLSHSNGNLQNFIPMIKPVEFMNNYLPVEPYILGIFLGNAGLSTGSPYFSTGDEELINALKQDLPGDMKLTKKGKYNWNIVNAFRGKKNPYIESFKKLGLWDHKSQSKFIPSCYKLANIESRISLLQGLMDTDGSVSKRDNHLEYTTVSGKLAIDIVELVQSLGGTARIHKKETKWTHKGVSKKGSAYRISIALPKEIVPFRLERKAQIYHPREKYQPTRGIKSIAYVGIKQAQCIMVDSPDHLYVTDDYILTHNTVQAIAFLSTTESYPALLVVPPHLVRNWQKELDKFVKLPQKVISLFDDNKDQVHVIKGLKPYKLPDASVYIIHYLLLRGWKNTLPEIGFKAVIFDEIQELRHTGTEKYSAASLVASECENVIGLSGTPIYNRGGEIWNVMNIIEYHCLGDWDSFTREWCTGYGSDIVKKPDLLGDYLRREGLMLRRRKADVLKELPPKRRVVQTVDFDTGTYGKLIQDAVEKAKGIDKISDFLQKGRVTREIVEETRQAIGIAKAPYVAAFVKMLLEGGEKVILGAYHHVVHDIYMKELREFNPVKITGRETAAEKAQSEEAFMSGKTNIVLLSLRAASGLNLQKATCTVAGELDWSPAVLSQFEDRAHRIGQELTDSLLCYYLVAEEGTDETMQEFLGLKVSQFVGIMGDRPETEEDKMLAQQKATEHMNKIVERLRGGRGKIEQSAKM